MAYYRDQRGQPRSVRELVQRVGRSIGATGNRARLPTDRPQESQYRSNSLQASSLEEEMGSCFPQCRGRSQQSSQADRTAARYTPYGRRGSKTFRLNPSRTPSGRAFTRTIFLLDHEEDSIPRGPDRQLMYEEGRVVDFVELNTAMTDDAVYTAIESVFTSILPDLRGESK